MQQQFSEYAAHAAEAYEYTQPAAVPGPRPADTAPLTMQQAIMRCHHLGILPTRINVDRLMNQFPVGVRPVSRQGE